MLSIHYDRVASSALWEHTGAFSLGGWHMGRPRYQWTEEIEDEILERITRVESAKSICRDDWLPSEATLYKRLGDDPEFAKRYARAREIQADVLFDECLAIADSQEGDVITVDGTEQTNHDVIARAKLRIDTRKWMAGKLRPKVYGEKAIIEGPGKNGEHLHKVSVDMSRLSDAALAEIVAAADASDAD